MTTDAPVIFNPNATPVELFTDLTEGMLACMAADTAIRTAKNDTQLELCVGQFDLATDRVLAAFGDLATREIIPKITEFLKSCDEAETSGSAAA